MTLQLKTLKLLTKLTNILLAISHINDGLKTIVSSDLYCPIIMVNKSMVRRQVSEMLLVAQHRYGC
jgi:hypothetical protein